jgi:hypothetical protein
MLATIGKYLIEIYWSRKPASNRKVCLHKVSSSRSVYVSLDKYGFISGVKFYLQRRKTCNRDYSITKKNEFVTIRTRTGHIILKENDINPVIVREFKAGQELRTS